MMFQYVSGTPVTQIYSGKDRFDIMKDKQVQCFFNGNAVLSSRGVDESFGTIVGLLVRASIHQPNTQITIKTSASMADFIKTVIDTVNKSEQEKIKVLEDKPDEITENKPKEARIHVESLNRYQEDLKVFSESFETALGLSEVLLKTGLPKTMWGAKELKASLSKMRTASSELITSREEFEIAAEQSDLRLGHIAPCLYESKMSNRKYIEDSVDYVITGFLTMKRMMVSFLQSCHGLYASDQLFKKYTGYPATWFYDPSVFFNFTERYEDVSANLIEASRAESSVIRPLYAWKSKVMGEQ